MSETWTVNSRSTAEFFVAFVEGEVEKGVPRIYTVKKETRTTRQNRTLHLLFRRMAEALNDAGFEIPHPFKPELEIPYSEESVKELLYRPIINLYFKKKGSSDLTTDQLSESMTILVDAVNRNTGVYVPIPTEENFNG